MQVKRIFVHEDTCPVAAEPVIHKKAPFGAVQKKQGALRSFCNAPCFFAVIAIDMTFLQAAADPGRSVGSAFPRITKAFRIKTSLRRQ